MTSNVSLRRCGRYDVSYCEAREKDCASASDVVDYGMETRCCGDATDRYIDRVLGVAVARGRWWFLFS